MRVQAWVSTAKLHSEVSFEVDIDDEDLEGLDEAQAQNLIDDLVLERVHTEIEWGWESPDE